MITGSAFLKDWLASVRRLRPHLRGGRYLIGAVVLTAACSAALEGLGVGLLVPLLSLLLGGENAAPMRPLLWLQNAFPGPLIEWHVAILSAIILVAITAKNVLLYSSQGLAARLKRRITINLRDALYQRMLAAEMRVFEQRTPGDMANAFTTEAYRAFLTVDFLLIAIQRICMVCFYLAGLCFISWPLVLVTIALGSVIGWSVRTVFKRLSARGTALTAANQALSSRLVETFGGIRAIRGAGAEAQEAKRFHHVNEAQAAAEEMAARAGQTLGPLTETLAVIGALTIVSIAYMGLVKPGIMLPSYLLGYGFILLRVLPLANQLYTVLGSLAHLSASIKELERWFETPTHPHRPFGSRPLPAIAHGIRFEKVSYKYPDRDPALRDIDLLLPSGKTVALVGPSGAGKSTLVSLLLRFREPASGRILVDDTEAWEISAESWQQGIAVVEQEAFLFHDTFENNIAFGWPHATREKVLEAARLACLDDVIATLPQGLDTIVGERGAMLSGGQRQRLAIARAVIRNPRVLVLDEATSALDALSEQRVQAALQAASRGRSVLMIAHRLSSIRNADWIVVLDAGRIAAQGTWSDLEQSSDLFQKLRGQS